MSSIFGKKSKPPKREKPKDVDAEEAKKKRLALEKERQRRSGVESTRVASLQSAESVLKKTLGA